MRSFWIASAALAALLVAPAPASRADLPLTATFDFDTPPLIDPGTGALQWTDAVTGLTISVTRSGAPVDVVDLNLMGVPDYGPGCLSPFGDPFTATPFTVAFSNVPPGFGVEYVSWDMGDFVGSDDDEWAVNTVAPGAEFASLVTDPREVIHDSDFVGQVFGSSNRYVRRDHAILQWNFLAGSPMFPMSMYVDHLVATLSPADVDGAFTNGEDQPASVPGGGGGNPNVSSVGGGGGTPIGALLYETQNSGITSGCVNGLVAKLGQASTKLEKGDAGGAVKLLQAFLAQLRGNSGKTVDSTVAELLAAHAQAIIDLLS